jgi:hypothetical protein
LPGFSAIGRETKRARNGFARLLIDLCDDHAGDEHAEARGVAAVERQFDDALRVDDF